MAHIPVHIADDEFLDVILRMALPVGFQNCHPAAGLPLDK